MLTGGVGGAKLVLGLAQIMAAEEIAAIVNTGDDFSHMGLHVSPDIDTLLYTLSGKANQAQGWGRESETWSFMDAVRSLGGEEWFALGDGDLALHVLRSQRMARGAPLSMVTADFARAWGIGVKVLPMSDAPVTTWLDTEDGELEFQRYFVEKRCAPRVRRVWVQGAQAAAPAPGVVEAIESAEAVLIAPSNPYLSIDPMLAIPAIRAALARTRAPVVAVSPLVGGKAVKGPTAKLMGEFGVQVNNAAIARHYGDLIEGMLINDGDDAPQGIGVRYERTLMHTLDDRKRVAGAALSLARGLGGA